jgi:medium-chain acyl-[acyl-carrier-protein] hydrolase
VSGARGPATAWLPACRPRETTALRLLCLPYAGGDTPIFAPWADTAPPEFEVLPVQLPGRGRRVLEPAYGELGPLVSALADGIAPALDGPFALFGHSMGALVAFELARELRRRDRPQPAHLLVAGRPAPQLPRRYAPLSRLPDGELLEELYRRYGYTPPEDDDGIDVLLDVMLPTIRRDVAVSDDYVYADEPPLDCPITAFGGLEDATVTRDELDAWRHQTRGRFETRLLPGGHFFLETEPTFLVRFIANSVRGTMR